jgi:alkylation response protein AidB-like acyl-CoA dehydrogenase
MLNAPASQKVNFLILYIVFILKRWDIVSTGAGQGAALHAMTAVESAEVALFVSTTQAFLDKEASLRAARDLRRAGLSFDRAWWRRAAGLGWTSLLVPEELGGGSVSGNGIIDLARIAEMLGKTAAAGPLHPVSIVLSALVDAENSQHHAKRVESLMTGETIATWAAYEPGQSWDPLQPNVTATVTDQGYRISGHKDRVEAAAESDVMLVVARCERGVRQFLVPTDASAVHIEQQPSIDLVKRYARVYFEDVHIEHDAAVGTIDQTPALIGRQSQIALILQCSELVGVLDAVLDTTISWLRDRYSFGRALASYQALKHRVADMKTRLEACRATTAHAVRDVATRSPEADISTMIAKSYVGEWASNVVQDCIQLHGGIGLTWEHDMHLYLRRTTLYRAMFGTPEQHNLGIFARLRESGQGT